MSKKVKSKKDDRSQAVAQSFEAAPLRRVKAYDRGHIGRVFDHRGRLCGLDDEFTRHLTERARAVLRVVPKEMTGQRANV